MADTVKETVEFMQAYANEKNIQLLTKIDELPEIEADPDRISQVLRNLINNAIKFSENKSKIEINAKLLDEQIEFSVRDYGCGLSAENQIRVFEPFYQVESASQRRHGGTGLGLAICRGIVESQRGKIWVESKEGAGSKFTFTFPLKPVRKIEPIKVLFSKKGVIDRKIKEEFSSMLGPLGEGEFIELQSKNALGKDDILEYIDSLTKKYILSPEKGDEFKIKIGNIFGEEIEEISEKENKVYKKFKEEVLKRD